MMKKIQKLPPHLVAQIAAGEVIERPAFAVKELLDNAIDAKATSVFLSVQNSGFKKITVSDNGEGMSKEDLLESYKIHTTSKVKNSETLDAINSLGFRGEALASIAAVSNLIIKSREKSALSGYQLEVKDSIKVELTPVGMPVGTVVEIENIFSNLPARKKFLKSETTELRHIIEIFENFALAYPNISFKLIHNKKIIYDLTKTTNSKYRIDQIIGTSITDFFLPVNDKDTYLSITGFIAAPQIATRSNSKQLLFVNNRRITDRQISQSIKESFVNLLPPQQQPIYLVFIKTPVELIDVNIHPRKEHVAFFNKDTVLLRIKETISQVLSLNDLTFTKNALLKKSSTHTFLGTKLKNNVDAWSVKNAPTKIDYNSLSQLHKLYLLVQTKNGILFIDQHAAHERILFEQFKKEFLNEKNKSNKSELSKPLKLHLNVSQTHLLEEYKTHLQIIGFEFDSSLNLVKVPTIFKDRNIPELINELLEDLEKNISQDIDQFSLKILQFLACKNAVKAGDILTKSEGIKLIKKLEITENNYTCPHGRPTRYFFPLNELNRIFKRF